MGTLAERALVIGRPLVGQSCDVYRKKLVEGPDRLIEAARRYEDASLEPERHPVARVQPASLGEQGGYVLAPPQPGRDEIAVGQGSGGVDELLGPAYVDGMGKNPFC